MWEFGLLWLAGALAFLSASLWVLVRKAARSRRPVWKECSEVRFDDRTLRLRGRSPGGGEFTEELPWDGLVRVAYQKNDVLRPDWTFLLSDQKEHSYCVPTEAAGGVDLVAECVRRRLLGGEAVLAAQEGDLVLGPLLR